MHTPMWNAQCIDRHIFRLLDLSLSLSLSFSGLSVCVCVTEYFVSFFLFRETWAWTVAVSIGSRNVLATCTYELDYRYSWNDTHRELSFVDIYTRMRWQSPFTCAWCSYAPMFEWRRISNDHTHTQADICRGAWQTVNHIIGYYVTFLMSLLLLWL